MSLRKVGYSITIYISSNEYKLKYNNSITVFLKQIRILFMAVLHKR